MWEAIEEKSTASMCQVCTLFKCIIGVFHCESRKSLRRLGFLEEKQTSLVKVTKEIVRAWVYTAAPSMVVLCSAFLRYSRDFCVS